MLANLGIRSTGHETRAAGRLINQTASALICVRGLLGGMSFGGGARIIMHGRSRTSP